MDIVTKQNLTSGWFKALRDSICSALEQIEQEYSKSDKHKFQRQPWQRTGGGGGEMSLIKGQVFEKGGVNISTVYGEFSEEFRKQIPGAEQDPSFWASGISLVIHPFSPLVPAIHMNTRFIVTTKSWFGGGMDLTPAIANLHDCDDFHAALRNVCNQFNSEYYRRFSEECDRYFYLPHRSEPRGIGGIFYDYLESEAGFEQDFAFTQEVGKAFAEIYGTIVRRNMYLPWTDVQKEQQLIKRGRYVEFNLLYDRGTKFGLMTGGNTEAILMSLPPEVRWL
jgi:coproporphyrinogen III oxidase